MVCGALQTSNGSESHAYSILKPKENRYILYDTTNPIQILNHADEKYVTPAFMGLNDKPSEEIIFDYNLVESQLADGYKIDDKLSRKYVIPYNLDMNYVEYKGKSF